MKKILAVLVVALLVLTGCGSKDKPSAGAAGETYKIGTAILTSEKIKPLGEEDAAFEANTTYATVVMQDDKFVNVFIDTAQNSITVDAEDTLTGFTGKGTKREQGDDYNMVAWGGAVAEWYAQIDTLQEWIIGKTLDEVLAADISTEDIKTSVTIGVDGYIKTLEQAVKNAVTVEDVTKIATTSVTGANKDGIEINTTVAAVALNSKDEIAYVYIDDAQSKAESAKGEITATGSLLSKRELGDDYNMVAYGGATAEWYEQIDSLQAFLTGKTASDISGIKYAEGVADEADIKSTVTIATQGHIGVVSKALEQVKNVK